MRTILTDLFNADELQIFSELLWLTKIISELQSRHPAEESYFSHLYP